MGNGVIVYPSARESGEQNTPQNDEVWIELRRKSKNSAQKWKRVNSLENFEKSS